MQVVVANPSSTSEIDAAADGLGRAGMLERYHVPVAFTPSQERWVRKLPDASSAVLMRELLRRRLPPGVPESTVKRTASVSDLVRVAAQRSPRLSLRTKTRWSFHHARWFDYGVSRGLRTEDDALLAVAGDPTQRTLDRARKLGVETWLDFPLAHPASIFSTLREEARRVPAYASSLYLSERWQWAQWQWLVDETHRQADIADHVLVLSTYARRTFLEAGIPEQKIHLTPLGTDTEMFRPAPRADDGVFRVLFVGQIGQRKGVSYLVDAFRTAAIPGSELLLVGHIIADAPWAGVKGIRYQPALPRHELPAIYASADVLVLPSLAEGFPVAPMEMMASGRPVIVSEHTFGSDVIEDGINGWTVPIRDVDAIVERLRVLALDPDMRMRLGAAARRTAEQYTWRRYGDRIADLIGRPLSHH